MLLRFATREPEATALSKIEAFVIIMGGFTGLSEMTESFFQAQLLLHCLGWEI